MLRGERFDESLSNAGICLVEAEDFAAGLDSIEVEEFELESSKVRDEEAKSWRGL
jgi:hypothetical protein